MEKKSSVGKYILICEPKYVYHQLAIQYKPNGSTEITKIKKYTDIVHGVQGEKKIKKNTLSDIDRITTSCYDLYDFFDKHVDSKIYSPYRDGLHKIFIGYMRNGSMKTLNCVFNDDKLNAKQTFVDGNKIYDYIEIEQCMDLIKDPDSSFTSFMIDSYNRRETGISKDTINLTTKFRYLAKVLTNHCDSGVLESYQYAEKELLEKLISYKEYREMFLLRGRYIQKLEQDKRELEIAKQTIMSSGFFQPVNEEIYEQLTLFPMEKENHESAKTKKYGKK